MMGWVGWGGAFQCSCELAEVLDTSHTESDPADPDEKQEQTEPERAPTTAMLRRSQRSRKPPARVQGHENVNFGLTGYQV